MHKRILELMKDMNMQIQKYIETIPRHVIVKLKNKTPGSKNEL